MIWEICFAKPFSIHFPPVFDALRFFHTSRYFVLAPWREIAVWFIAALTIGCVLARPHKLSRRNSRKANSSATSKGLSPARSTNARTGRFSEANKGTLFLDEIGDMTLPMQAKILRVLQDRIVTPVGASVPVSVDVRDGKFREDLFYQLSVVGVTLPPLRERGADIHLQLLHAKLKEHGSGDEATIRDKGASQ